MPEKQQEQPDYGPTAASSEHHRGDRISYSQDGGTYTGTIVWVATPGRVSENGPESPTHYIVDRDGFTSFPDIVNPGEVAAPTASNSL
jgi:hypothetical protein